MTNLWVLRDKIRMLYGRFSWLVDAIVKFILADLALAAVKSQVGHPGILNKPYITLMISVACAFLPAGAIGFFVYAYLLMQIATISIELFVVVAIIGAFMFLLYFCFKPKDGHLMALAIIMIIFKITGPLPILIGLVFTPLSAIPVIFGVVTANIMQYVSQNYLVLINPSDSTQAITKLLQPIEFILNNNELWLIAFALVATILVVYVIRRLSVNYAWDVAIIAGGLAYTFVILIGSYSLNIPINYLHIILNTVMAIACGYGIKIFYHSADYSRAESTQFEDEEYYYYVKAVPKIKVTAPKISVTKINARKKKDEFEDTTIMDDVLEDVLEEFVDDDFLDAEITSQEQE